MKLLSTLKVKTAEEATELESTYQAEGFHVVVSYSKSEDVYVVSLFK